MKDVHIVGRKMARNGPKTANTFSVSFRISLYCFNSEFFWGKKFYTKKYNSKPLFFLYKVCVTEKRVKTVVIGSMPSLYNGLGVNSL